MNCCDSGWSRSGFLQAISFSHDRWEDFVHFLIPNCPSGDLRVGPVANLISYIFYKLAASCFWIYVLVTVVTPSPYFYTYLTDWSVMAITGHSLAGCVLAICCLVNYSYRVRRAEHDVAWSRALPFQFYWILSLVTHTLCLAVPVLYWTLVYGRAAAKTGKRADFSFDNVSVHACNGVFALVDVIVTKYPYKFGHVYLILVVAPCYLLTTYVVQEQRHKPAYDFLDWTKPGATAPYLLLSAIVTAILYFSIVLLCKARDWLVKTDDPHTTYSTISVEDEEVESV